MVEQLKHICKSQNPDEIVDYLFRDAGSSNPDYFHADKASLNKNFKLQQVPQEYMSLLTFLRSRKIGSYLELGIGNGGSFVVNTAFMSETLSLAIAVDNLAYGEQIGQNEEEVEAFMWSARQISPTAKIVFFKETTDEFFFKLGVSSYDCIFIDADHSYEAAKRDFENARHHIKKNGCIIFHDIASKACPGIMQLWSEVKTTPFTTNMELIHSDTCGIGVLIF